MGPRRASRKAHFDDGDDDYRKKRERNNEAVKKSRFKSKQKTQETQERIEKLKEENQTLEDKVRTKKKELGILKELFMANCSNSSNVDLNNSEIKDLLENDSDDDSKSSKSNK